MGTDARGIAGIAPEGTLMSISNALVLTPNSPQQLADGINFAWQNGADIINNSWGHNVLQSAFLDDAVEDAVTQGRNGLGTVVVFATGNDDNNSISYPSTNPDVIAVGAVSMCDQRNPPLPVMEKTGEVITEPGLMWWPLGFWFQLLTGKGQPVIILISQFIQLMGETWLQMITSTRIIRFGLMVLLQPRHMCRASLHL